MFLSNYHCAPLLVLRRACAEQALPAPVAAAPEPPAPAVPAAVAAAAAVAVAATAAEPADVADDVRPATPPLEELCSGQHVAIKVLERESTEELAAEDSFEACFPEEPLVAAFAAGAGFGAAGGSSVSRLQPPPAPAPACAVAPKSDDSAFRLAPPPTALPSVRDGGAVTVIETLIEPCVRDAKPTAAKVSAADDDEDPRILNVMGVVADDSDEELLGGREPRARGPLQAALAARTPLADSGSDSEVGAAGDATKPVVSTEPTLSPAVAAVAAAAQATEVRQQELLRIEAATLARLDRFFADETLWPRVQQQLAAFDQRLPPWLAAGAGGGARRTFRVQVPSPYPGVQYRKSKSLEDRYPRYAKHGSFVTGVLEPDGEWLRISDVEFLPVRVGAVPILAPAEDAEAAAGVVETVELSSLRLGNVAGGDTGGSGGAGIAAAAGGVREEAGGSSSRGLGLAARGTLDAEAVVLAAARLREAGEAGDSAAKEMLREAVRRSLPEEVARNALTKADEWNQHLASASVNPFSNGNTPPRSSQSPRLVVSRQVKQA